MRLGQAVLLLYGALLVAGGVWGYQAAGSTPSLIAGTASGAALVLLWLVSRSRRRRAAAYWGGAAVSLALGAVFLHRLTVTGAFFPSGALLILSLVALVFLVFSATEGRTDS